MTHVQIQERKPNEDGQREVAIVTTMNTDVHNLTPDKILAMANVVRETPITLSKVKSQMTPVLVWLQLSEQLFNLKLFAGVETQVEGEEEKEDESEAE